ncbi:MAG: DUF4340 domain-containing protein [Treponema sp.]|nr:DUF4340 domain-containing protein [Treponema sp.]
MTKRKLTLLIITGVLLVIAILQGIFSNISPVKTIKFDAEPYSISVTSNSNSYELKKQDGKWYIGDNNFLAKNTDVNQIIKTIKEIKVLDKVGSASNELLEERYDLNNDKAITVIASTRDGKALRTIKIGKASSTGSQSYITIDNKKEVYLVSGNFNSVYNKTEESLKSDYIYELSSKDFTSVTVTRGSNTWTITKTSKPNETAAWQPSGSAENLVVDAGKIDAWLTQIATLKVSKWLPDDTSVSSNKEASVQIMINQEPTEVNIYKEGYGDNAKYICVCNRTTHKAELAKLTAQKFIKDANELKVSE